MGVLNESVSATTKVENTNVSSDTDMKKVETSTRSKSFNSTIKVSQEFSEKRRRASAALLDTSALFIDTKSGNNTSKLSHDSLYDNFLSSLKTYRQQLPQSKLAVFDNSWSRIFNSNSNNYFDVKSELLFQELKSVAEVH